MVAYFIKYFLLIFADGTFGPPVFVVANDFMEKDAVDIYPVQGLDISAIALMYNHQGMWFFARQDAASFPVD